MLNSSAVLQKDVFHIRATKHSVAGYLQQWLHSQFIQSVTSGNWERLEQWMNVIQADILDILGSNSGGKTVQFDVSSLFFTAIGW